MKHKIILFLFTIIFFSCGSEDNNTLTQEEPLKVELIATKTTVSINEVVPFEVKTNRSFGSITYSTDSFTTSGSTSKSLGDSFGTSLTLYVDTANFGNITYSIRVADADDNQKTATSTLSFTVEKGNAVHIQEVLVNDFYDKDNTWDTEFSSTDPNRLADVFFSLSKPHIDLFYRTKN
jgi:hypothetical protein